MAKGTINIEVYSGSDPYGNGQLLYSARIPVDSEDLAYEHFQDSMKKLWAAHFKKNTMTKEERDRHTLIVGKD